MSIVAKRFLKEETARTEGLNTTQVRSALVADVLRRNGESRQGPLPLLSLLVHGESMLPALWPGDVVEIAPCSMAQVERGEIVLALRDGRLFLHRLVSVSGRGFVLRGDSMPCADPVFPEEALLGRLVARIGQRLIDKKQKPEQQQKQRLAVPVLLPGWGAKCSRIVGILLCHWNFARRAALKVHGRVHRRGGTSVIELKQAERGALTGVAN
jgi:hypothetical protein